MADNYIMSIDDKFHRAGREAWHEGGVAFIDGVEKKDNPYDPGSFMSLQWGKGWVSAKREKEYNDAN
jgi:hypothetical protein